MSESDERPGSGDADGTDAGEEGSAETEQEASEEAVGEEEDGSADAVDPRVEALEEERAALEERIAELEAERDELTTRLKRAAADFENYKKRQSRRREQLAAEATAELIERLLGVRDNLKRALEDEAEDIESLREGVKLTLSEFDRVLDAENVEEIDPEPGTEVDPERHEVMLQVESEYPEGHVVDVYQAGYERDEKVMRPAQVTVSEGARADPEAESGEQER